MSAFFGRTPVIRLVLRNHIARTSYPEEGSLQAVVETGYDGFLAVPEGVFRALELDSTAAYRRTVVTAGGRTVELRASAATLEVGGTGKSYDGLLETGPGIEEVLAGTSLLLKFKLTLNYCAGVFRAEPCA